MAAVVHERLRCPRCSGRGARELSRLSEEGHAVFMCIFCKHTWCEAGRQTSLEEFESNTKVTTTP